jgi:hypothetical protein
MMIKIKGKWVKYIHQEVKMKIEKQLLQEVRDQSQKWSNNKRIQHLNWNHIYHLHQGRINWIQNRYKMVVLFRKQIVVLRVIILYKLLLVRN